MPLTSRPRSASSLRSSSYSNSRPISLGQYISSYSSPYSVSPYSFTSYNGCDSNYQSPYFPNGYRRSPAANGYASLIFSSKSPKKSEHISRRDLSRGYRERSLSRNSTPLSGGLGSRSISLTSLNSEGYNVSKIVIFSHFVSQE